MPKTSIFLHRSVFDWCDFIATVLDTSRSEIIEDMVKHVRDNDLEEEVWEDYADALESYTEAMEEAEGSEEEEEGIEEGSEEEEEKEEEEEE